MGNERRTGDGAKVRGPVRTLFPAGLFVALLLASPPSPAADRPWSPEPDSKAIEVFLRPENVATTQIRVFPSAGQILIQEFETRKDIDSAVRAVSSTLGLPPPLARELVYLLIGKAWLFRSPRDTDFDWHRCAEDLRRRFAALLKASKYHMAIQAAVEDQALYLGGCSLELYRDIVEGAPKPLEFGLRLAERMSCGLFLVQLHQLEPSNRAILWALASGANELKPEHRLALLEDLSQRLATSALDDPQFQPTVVVQHEFIQQLLDAGLPAQAIDAYDRLDPMVQDGMLRGVESDADLSLDGLPLRTKSWRLHARLRGLADPQGTILLELAAAQESLGHGQKAQELFSRIPWNGPELTKEAPSRGATDSEIRTPVLKWLLLDRLLRDPTSDPYVWLRFAYLCHTSTGLEESRLWAGLMIKSLPGEEHAAIRWTIERLYIELWQIHDHGVPPAEDLSFLAGMGDQFEARVQRYRRALIEAVASISEPVAAAHPQSTSSKGLRRWITGQADFKFPEKHLPDEERTKRASKYIDEDPPTLPAGVAPLPPGHSLVRFELTTDHAVAITRRTHQELEGWLYSLWAHLSNDRGATWTETLYIGDRVRGSIPASSRHPLLVGETLELETQNKLKISDKPIWKDTDCLAIIPLGTLRADADRDGLTDLMEIDLLLDPTDPDTDSDGLTDGEDPMPNVPWATHASQDQEWLLPLLSEIFGRARSTHVCWKPGPAGSDSAAPDAYSNPGLLKDQPPIFLIADPDRFQGLRPDRRVIVLGQEEYQRRFATHDDWGGPQMLRPVHLEATVLDREKTRVFTTWRYGGRQSRLYGTLELTRAENGWRATWLCGWKT
jgi:hypothetical protein